MTNVDARSRFFAILVGICFLTMLGVSLFHRFTNPGLTVNNFDGHNHPVAGVPAGGDQLMNAIGSLMRQVAGNPQDEKSLWLLVESLMGAGQWETAENFAQKALALQPADNPNLRGLYLRAIIYHNMGRNEQAAELLEKLLEKEENPSARYSLGILYAHFLGKPDLAATQFSRGLASGQATPALKSAMREELAKIPTPSTGQPAEKTGEKPENENAPGTEGSEP